MSKSLSDLYKETRKDRPSQPCDHPKEYEQEIGLAVFCGLCKAPKRYYAHDKQLREDKHVLAAIKRVLGPLGKLWNMDTLDVNDS